MKLHADSQQYFKKQTPSGLLSFEKFLLPRYLVLEAANYRWSVKVAVLRPSTLLIKGCSHNCFPENLISTSQ